MARYTWAQLPRWVEKVERRKRAVLKHAASEVVKEASKPKAKGGRMPVDTSFLRNSITGGGGSGPAAAIMAAGAMEPGDVEAFTWTAGYAGHVNSGARGRPGAHFLEGAAEQWPNFVAQGVAKARGMS